MPIHSSLSIYHYSFNEVYHWQCTSTTFQVMQRFFFLSPSTFNSNKSTTLQRIGHLISKSWYSLLHWMQQTIPLKWQTWSFVFIFRIFSVIILDYFSNSFKQRITNHLSTSSALSSSWINQPVQTFISMITLGRFLQKWILWNISWVGSLTFYHLFTNKWISQMTSK